MVVETAAGRCSGNLPSCFGGIPWHAGCQETADVFAAVHTEESGEGPPLLGPGREHADQGGASAAGGGPSGGTQSQPAATLATDDRLLQSPRGCRAVAAVSRRSGPVVAGRCGHRAGAALDDRLDECPGLRRRAAGALAVATAEARRDPRSTSSRRAPYGSSGGRRGDRGRQPPPRAGKRVRLGRALVRFDGLGGSLGNSRWRDHQGSSLPHPGWAAAGGGGDRGPSGRTSGRAVW